MKTLILGDLHHGRKHNCTYGDSKVWDYKSLNILKDLIEQHEPERLILCGDIFDNSKPTALAFSELIVAIAYVRRVIIIAGNHDISKIQEPIAFNTLGDLPNISIVRYGSFAITDDYTFVGWQPTNTEYIRTLTEVINQTKKNSIIITHASRLDFGNEMDNIVTDDILALAAAKNILIVSGHEHLSSISKNFIHLGSVVPHAISEVGSRYYMLDKELFRIEDDNEIILTRTEPDYIDPNKVYYVKSGKEVTTEDLKLETKDFNIDIVDSFWKEANKLGFTEELLND